MASCYTPISEETTMTVWIYTNERYPVGDKDRLKVFATNEDAQAWFEENDPEGVAFEYEVIGAA
jgi:hypothetical protein